MTSTHSGRELRVDVAIIGAGSGNMIWDEAFAGKTGVLVDTGAGARGSFGGTCLNVGCIPTKMFVLPADHVRSVEGAHRLGVPLSLDGPVDVEGIRARVFDRRIDPIADAGEEYRASMGNLTLLREPARFLDPHTLAIGDVTVHAEQIVLAAGSRPRWPDLPGFDDPDLVGSCLVTSDEIVRMDSVPRRIVILGGGVEAAEFSHILSAFGAEVTIVNRSPLVLRKLDHDIASRFTQLQHARVTLRLGEQVTGVRPAREDEDGRIVLRTEGGGSDHEYLADAIMVAIGRVPNGDLLDLDAAGIEVDEDGYVVVDEHQRTSVPHVWALGDVSSHHQLKHVANMEARVVRHNLLHPEDLRSAEHDVVPFAVFGHPQIAGVGATEEELADADTPYAPYVQRYGDVAYGWAMDDEDHVVKVLGEPGTGRVLGAHILGPQASTLIQPIVQMMTFGQDTREMVTGQYWIHPALSEVVENALLGMLTLAESGAIDQAPDTV